MAKHYGLGVISLETKTWEITKLPHGKNPIGCKRIYRIKYHADGTIDKAKARFVVPGNKQKQGLNYLETYAPIAKIATMRSLLAIVAIKS